MQTQRIDPDQVCSLLRNADHIVILAHQKPDGDTLGSAFALLCALEQMGKTARVESPDGFPPRYRFLTGDYSPKQFEAKFVVSTDVASLQLLGHLRETWGDRIDLCIDHHKSNSIPARYSLIDPDAPATAQVISYVVRSLGVKVDRGIANAVFTGLSTDTGCFRYDNVTAETHRIAADMIDCGAEHGKINKLMFDSTSKARLQVDKIVYDTLEFYFDDRCAVITINENLPETFGVTEEELDGISSFPRKIEGVSAGVTIRDRGEGEFRISLRCGDGIDAARICMGFGGGGHKNAAGCTMYGTMQEVKSRLLREIALELERQKIS